MLPVGKNKPQIRILKMDPVLFGMATLCGLAGLSGTAMTIGLAKRERTRGAAIVTAVLSAGLLYATTQFFSAAHHKPAIDTAVEELTTR
jgi:hypothetical protein